MPARHGTTAGAACHPMAIMAAMAIAVMTAMAVMAAARWQQWHKQQPAAAGKWTSERQR
jgi:hypothetical protein